MIKSRRRIRLGAYNPTQKTAGIVIPRSSCEGTSESEAKWGYTAAVSAALSSTIAAMGAG